LKILPARIAASASLRARFEREARAIAALSHPNICAVYDVGSDGGTEYLVMEYLEGETLSERIARGPLPLNLAIRYGVQIAEALHQAHRAGITHRDLKPGNIMLTSAGAKLLDFGLALTVATHDSAASNADIPTQVAPLTAEGAVLGTLPYMSPEQVEGRPVDPRTDIFALGAVLYEMVTGKRPFTGGSQSAVAAAIMATDPPPVRSLQPSTPTALDRIIVTALEKNPEDRWQTAHDIARQLRWMSDSSASFETVAAPPAPRRLRPSLLLALLLIPAALLAGWLWTRSTGRTSHGSSALLRLELSAPPGLAFAENPDVDTFAIAPDGGAVAFLATNGRERALYIRELATGEVRRVEGSESAYGPFWSPDAQWIAFSARKKLWKTKRSGDTPPQSLCDVADSAVTGTWRGHTMLLGREEAARDTGIQQVSDSGGDPKALTLPLKGEGSHSWPYFLPDGRHFVYHAITGAARDRDVMLATLDGRRIGVLLKNVSQVRSPAPGQLMFVRDGKLMMQRFDPAKAELVGDATAVAGDVSYFHPTSKAYFDAVPAGLVVYRTDTRSDRISIFDRRGAVVKLVQDGGRFFDVNLSGSGTKAAVTVINRGTGLGDIWLYDLNRGVQDRFTAHPAMEFAAVWAPDGKSIVYSVADRASPPHLVRRAFDGSLTDLTQRGAFRFGGTFAPDGATFYFSERNARTTTDVYRMSVSTLKAEPWLASEFFEGEPAASPAGEWLAYAADTAGVREIYLRNVTDRGTPGVRISTRGGVRPRWSRDGKELFFRSGRSICVARSASGAWDDAEVSTLFTSTAEITDYDVMPDGRSLIAIETIPGVRDELLHVLANWQ